jgi:hypothetical protein
MCRKIIFGYVFLVLIVIGNSQSQQVKPVTADIALEVITQSLKLSQEPQRLVLKISCQSAQEIQCFDLKLTTVQAIWSVVSATLNDQSLWLIKSGMSVNQDKILAWDFSTEDSKLSLFTHPWQVPYVLQLELQVNLKNINELSEDYADNLILESIMSGESFQCSTIGRGNRINFE